ncbi:Uncharacterized membrane protein, predicted efflux pump [Plasmopara halstedii]|uniref:Uncharacterized membrane protein, predicted efflux pump n=1 Tax=Plasmopara halstedii TaxID=4781 RepID=A0A0P1AGN9_PLAHL|nr:Uncharacterized membrane protein, predicted efflux pump [Plasmopara halstedii]CEG40101.1 Uncharacterized membrane protein, predicted efflux pump [Plasmopara halstedii]|eukprot:XP_024576470.1 Uncharacterized membrane protein, predicted efflux pump [Plasmopara halstedii]
MAKFADCITWTTLDVVLSKHLSIRHYKIVKTLIMMTSIGEDDGSGTAESGGDSSSGNSSDNSGLIRKQGCTTDYNSCQDVTKISWKKFGDGKSGRKSKLDNMTRQYAGYGTLQSARFTHVRNDASRATWKINIERLKSETCQQSSPRTNTKSSGSHRYLHSKRYIPDGQEESGDESETSNSSYNSSDSSNSPTKPILNSKHSSELDAGRFLPQVLRSQTSYKKRHKVTEKVSLLRSYSHDLENNNESGEKTELLPDIKTEVHTLIKLANPVILTYVLEFFPALVSMTLVGHLESPLTKQYLDGVALSTMFLNLTAIGIGFGLATAMDTLCSQAYGAGKPKKLGIYLQSGMIILGITLIPVFFINWYTEALLLLMGQPPKVAAFAGRFSQILLPGIPAIYIYEMLKKVMQAQNVVLPMVYIAGISNVVNLVLGVYLTFYTSLGFDGTAIARLVSEIVLPLCLVPYFMRYPDIPAEWWSGWHAKEAVESLSIFLKLGIPGAAMLLLEWVSFEIMAAIVGWLPNSVIAISVHSVLVNVSTFAFNIFMGISVAANVLDFSLSLLLPQGVLRGTGRLTLGAYINFVSYFVLGLPIGTYLAFSMDMGVTGMWSGLTIGIFFGCVVSFIKICKTDWKGMTDAALVRTS